MHHEIEIKKSGKRVALLTVHGDDTVAAWDVKQNLEVVYPKEDGYTLTMERVEEVRSRIITIMTGPTIMSMPETRVA